jgi:myo-inositol 2-dehydrogenase/D-chiro-inositol 1-dehydrogenase
MTAVETSAGVPPVMADVPPRELCVAVLGVGLMGADQRLPQNA